MAQPVPPQDFGDPAAPLVAYAQSELEIVMSSANNLDTQGLGLMAVAVGVMAVIAAARASLGPAWWLPIPVLAISVVMCLRVLAIARRGVVLGITVAAAITSYAGLTEAQINAALLKPLGSALSGTEDLVAHKSKYVGWAVVWLVLAAVAAGICAVTA
jgi:hypothetical protein